MLLASSTKNTSSWDKWAVFQLYAFPLTALSVCLFAIFLSLLPSFIHSNICCLWARKYSKHISSSHPGSAYWFHVLNWLLPFTFARSYCGGVCFICVCVREGDGKRENEQENQECIQFIHFTCKLVPSSYICGNWNNIHMISAITWKCLSPMIYSINCVNTKISDVKNICSFPLWVTLYFNTPYSIYKNTK